MACPVFTWYTSSEYFELFTLFARSEDNCQENMAPFHQKLTAYTHKESPLLIRDHGID